MKHNPGPDDIRNCGTISLWLDPSTASTEELKDFALLQLTWK